MIQLPPNLMHVLLSEMVSKETDGLLVNRGEILFTTRPPRSLASPVRMAALSPGVRVSETLEGLRDSPKDALERT